MWVLSDGRVQIESLNKVSMDDFKQWAKQHLETGADGARKLSIQVSYVYNRWHRYNRCNKCLAKFKRKR